MVKARPSVEEKRELARRQITEVSLELFLEKGYEDTTTRDIINQAGILNGSLYNRFRNKDEILISIVKEATEEILHNVTELLKRENNVLLAASFPAALELYASSKWRNVADLMYEVHRRWDAVQMCNGILGKWFEEFMSDYGFKNADDVKFEMIMASLTGATGDMIGCYAHGNTLPYRDALKHYMLLLSTTLHIPAINIDGIIDRLSEILESEGMTFLGYDLSKGPVAPDDARRAGNIYYRHRGLNVHEEGDERLRRARDGHRAVVARRGPHGQDPPLGRRKRPFQAQRDGTREEGAPVREQEMALLPLQEAGDSHDALIVRIVPEEVHRQRQDRRRQADRSRQDRGDGPLQVRR